MPLAGGQPSASPLAAIGGPSSQLWKKVPATRSPGARPVTPAPTASTTPAPSESGELYERFEQVVLVHGVRWAKETAVVRHRIETLRSHELLGEEVRAKLRYYPTVTREPYVNRGRLTALIESGRLFRDLALPPLDPGADRLMVCGSPAMLSDTCALLAAHGFRISPHIGEPGDYVIERAFVTR